MGKIDNLWTFSVNRQKPGTIMKRKRELEERIRPV